jgi:hypothetical protein
MTETFDPDTGEVFSGIAADGRPVHPAANSLGDFFKMMEDGQFDADVHADLQELAADMQNDLHAGLGKSAAKLTITVEIALEPTGNGPVFYMRAGHKIARPTLKRQRSIAWTTDDNRFTPNKPHQGILFGALRDVTDRRPARDVG